MKMVNFTTDLGDFDLSFSPAGFEEVDDHSIDVPLRGTVVTVAALDDVITSKAITNRPKDHATPPILYALRDEIARKHRR